MMLWLTPILIMVENVRPVSTIETSLNTCCYRIPALLVYGLVSL